MQQGVLFYYLLFFLLLLFTYIEYSGKCKKKHLNAFLCFFVFVLFVLSSIRWETGYDWDSYKNIFLYSDNEYYLSNYKSEWVFLLLNRVIRRFTDNYSWCLTAQASIYFFVLWRFLRKVNNVLGKTGKVGGFAVLTLMFSECFAGLFATRSTLVGLICLSLVFDIYEKKRWIFFLKVIIATALHTSALFFIPAYFVFHMKRIRMRRFVILFLLGGVVCGVISPFALRQVVKIPLLSRYAVYMVDNNQLPISIGLIKWSVLLIVLLYFYRQIRNQRENSNTEKEIICFSEGVIRLFVLGVSLYIAGNSASEVAGRVSGLYLTCYVIAFMGVGAMAQKNKKLFCVFVVLFSFVCLYGRIHSPYMSDIVPFQTIFGSI